eukprot:15399-Heterococcus_DN1.PRE.1
MADEKAAYKCEYLDLAEDADPQVTNWLPRPGMAKVRMVTYANGCIYEGYFDSERMKTGNSKYTWMTPGPEEGDEPIVSACYEGIYVEGKKAGYGKMTYPNGDVYTGEWKDNRTHGQGTYRYKTSGDIFSGSWEHGKKVGQGLYQFGADDSIMEGAWLNGTITEGTWKFRDGTIYTGKFTNGKPVGAGSFTFPSGIKQTGIYTAVKSEEDEQSYSTDATAVKATTWRGDSVLVC